MATNLQTGASLLPTTQTVTNQYDPTLSGTLTDIINASRVQANTPYTPYTGQRIAALSPEELQANQAIRDSFLKTQPMYQQGMDLVNQGTTNLNNLTANMGQWNPAMAQQYMNPYISNVVDVQTQNALRNSDIERNRIRSNAATNSAFGGGRQAVAEQELTDSTNRNLNESVANLLMQGYNTSYDQFNKDRSFGMDAVNQYNTQGASTIAGADALVNARNQDVQNLSTVGKNLRDVAQANLDTGYSDFVNQRDYDKNQLGWISNLLSGVNMQNYQTGSTQTNRTQLPGSGNSFMSDLMSGIGMASNLANTNIGKSVGDWISKIFAEGGHVKAYAEGGEVKRFADGGGAFSSYPLSTLVQQLQKNKSMLNDNMSAQDLIRYTQAIRGMEQELASRRSGMGLNPTTDLPATTPPFNPMVQANVPTVDVGYGPASRPVMAQEPAGINETLDAELANANAPATITDLIGAEQQPSMADLFTYSGGPLDQLFQPNPALIMGLNMRMGQMDVNNPEWWQAAAQLDAMNQYETLRSSRMGDDVKRGSAIGTLINDQTAKQEDQRVKNEQLKLEQAKTQLQGQAVASKIALEQARIEKLGKTNPATARDSLNALKAVAEAYNTGDETIIAASKAMYKTVTGKDFDDEDTPDNVQLDENYAEED